MIEKPIVYATPGGEALSADAYLPDSKQPAPVIIAIHGGSWKRGVRSSYKYLGPFFAARGFALLTLDYRLATDVKNLYPAAVDDVRAAVRYVREHAAELNVDPGRIVLLGDSAGGHLAALVGLTERPQVKVVVGVVGVYDLAAQWQHDLPVRPSDNIAQGFLGVPLPDNRQLYFEASPVSHATTANAAGGPSFMLAWSLFDDIVDHATQSEVFLRALKQAGFYTRSLVQQTNHFWIGDPLDEAGSHSAYFAVRLLRFLEDRFSR
ncbi:MAG TPA: alpha/beta hydrolase [Candidatus Lustribacter sp.]|jgi:acetyl esterase/lipase|nr:alpha/beta hydrolase [Candidatus Lustribacter sp.]